MRIGVLGTLAIHLAAEVERLPRPGESVPSRGFLREPGGTGTWQAIAAARLGAEVTVYGCVGSDPGGDEILAELNRAGIRTAPIERSATDPTGASLVFTAPNRQGLSAQVRGANDRVDEAYIGRFLSAIRDVDALLVDLALPGRAVAALLAGLPSSRPIVVLHQIPAHDPPRLPWSRVDFVVGSREELAAQTGGTASSPEDAPRAAEALLGRGARSVVVTAGSDGAYLAEAAGVTRFPGHALPVVDPTGAGDAFISALAVKLGGGRGPYEAVGFAAAASALATARRGGSASLPTAAEIHQLLARLTAHPDRS